MNRPEPASASASKLVRIGASAGSRLLKRSLNKAQAMPIPAIAHRGRNPAASMMGNR